MCILVWAVFPTGIQNCRYDIRVTVHYIILLPENNTTQHTRVTLLFICVHGIYSSFFGWLDVVVIRSFRDSFNVSFNQRIFNSKRLVIHLVYR